MPQVSGTSPRAFVNYRREDTEGTAGALASTLRHLLDVGDIFLDRDGIQSGEPWPERLREELQRSTVVLVLIGARWLTAADRFGVRRLDDEADWVRVEITEALGRGKTVIPILLDGATPPPVDAFRTVKDLEGLANLQALEFSSKAEALTWFDRAKEATLLGDEHGRVDHESLGRTLAQIAYCLSLANRYEEAIDVSKRAVAAKELGDVHGRIDAVSVGRGLHQVGYWLTHLGRHEEALVWYERATTVSEQGDVYGRVDHDGIGRSLHQVATSLMSLGREGEARDWLERALAEKLRGDTFGRIDEQSVELTRTTLTASAGARSGGRPGYPEAARIHSAGPE